MFQNFRPTAKVPHVAPEKSPKDGAGGAKKHQHGNKISHYFSNNFSHNCSKFSLVHHHGHGKKASIEEDFDPDTGMPRRKTKIRRYVRFDQLGPSLDQTLKTIRTKMI